MEQRSGLISTPSSSSTQTETGGQSGDNRGTLHLRSNGSQRKGSKKKSKAKVSWSDDVVDNEHMNKKKSKVCCIFHPHKEFGESSSDSDSDSSNGSSASEDEEDRQGRRNNYIHNRNHNHSHDHNHDHDHDNDHDSHDHEHSSDRHIHRMRSPSPNAYERQPHFKPNVRPSAIENTN